MALAALLLGAGAACGEPHLCRAGEVVEWSCSARGKVYSICSSSRLDAEVGYMQYRVGKKGGPLEFSYPEDREHPKDRFRYELYSRSGQMNFSNAGYDYAINEGLDGSASIAVDKAGKEVARVDCMSSSDTLTLTTKIKRFSAAGLYP